VIRLRRLALLTVVAGVSFFAEANHTCAQEACAEPQPAGFRLITDVDPWDRPWAFVRTAAGTSAPPVFDHGWSRTPSPLDIRLDDGALGILSVVQRQCAKGEDCSPYDCGCTGRNESYWIEVHRRDGRLVARKHLWAAHDRFQIIAVDLVDGIGDELLIARIPAHASPPIGWDLKIWQVEPRMSEVGNLPHLTRSFPTTPVSCAWWMATLTVESTAPKPRVISLRVELGRTGCCELMAAEKLVADLRRRHTLQFDGVRQRYVLAGPATYVFTGGP